MRRFATWAAALTLAASVASGAGKVERISSTYTYYAPSTVSLAQAKAIALDRAKLQAIADAFGTNISQATTTRVVNSDGESKVDLFSTGASSVKGEWVETTGEPVYKIDYTDDMLAVTVTVHGKIRPLQQAAIDLTARILRNGLEERFEDDSFRSGDDLFLQFQSPVKGSLLVYLVDHMAGEAYCLLPYASSEAPSYAVERDRPYVFFSPANEAETARGQVDEYTMTCSGDAPEHNDIVLLFSPGELVKSNTTASTATVPRHLSLRDFERWKADITTKDPKIQTINKTITINP